MRRVGTDARPDAESATAGVVWRGRSMRSCVVASCPLGAGGARPRVDGAPRPPGSVLSGSTPGASANKDPCSGGPRAGADAVGRYLKERFSSIEAVSFPKVHRVEAVSQEDVQALAGKAPEPRILRQHRPQAGCGAVEFCTEAAVVTNAEWAQVEATETGAGGSDGASNSRPSHARAADRDTRAVRCWMARRSSAVVILRPSHASTGVSRSRRVASWAPRVMSPARSASLTESSLPA